MIYVNSMSWFWERRTNYVLYVVLFAVDAGVAYFGSITLYYVRVAWVLFMPRRIATKVLFGANSVRSKAVSVSGFTEFVFTTLARCIEIIRSLADLRSRMQRDSLPSQIALERPERAMLDLLMLALTAVGAAAMIGYVRACAHFQAY